MAATIQTEANVNLPAGVETQILALFTGRQDAAFQLQSPGEAWINLTGTAAVVAGFRVSLWETTTLSKVFSAGQKGGGPANRSYNQNIDAVYVPGPQEPASSTGVMRVLDVNSI